MIGSVKQVVIVGGGTAGWLSACLLAARRPELAITLVEAPDIPTIGVGEGTWPTMRETLATIGIAEAEFLSQCDASFKQGSRFDGWVDGSAQDSYLHPFTPPPPGDMAAMLQAWRTQAPELSFAALMTPQAAACDESLAPRQRAMPDYAGALNYGYHLDAGKFAALLKRHATTRLGVTHVSAQVTAVADDEVGNIASLRLHDGRELAGDFFIDCSGLAAILIGDHCAVPWVDRSDVSFNDSALAVQVPVEPGSAIASQTIGTAHEAGWIWDIALPTRRGIGCVFSSRFMDDERAEDVLRNYIAARLPSADLQALRPRKLTFSTGHRERFWQGNCLAVGLSAGFIEPLEASAIVTIELSIKALAENFPRRSGTMGLLAGRFNELFCYRWDRIVEFLKLHYVLSRRPAPYWLAQRDPATVPARLAECLELWRDQPPSVWDLPRLDELFCAASQQYVLYGMGFPVPAGAADAAATQALAEVRQRSRALAAALPSNRTYLDALRPVAAAAPIAMHGAAVK